MSFTKEKREIVLIDAPTLFETKILKYICYPICVIYVDEDIQIERLIKRDIFVP